MGVRLIVIVYLLCDHSDIIFVLNDIPTYSSMRMYVTVGRSSFASYMAPPMTSFCASLLIYCYPSWLWMSWGQVIARLFAYHSASVFSRKNIALFSLRHARRCYFGASSGLGAAGLLRGGAQRVGCGTSFSEHDETAVGGPSGPRPQRWCSSSLD